MDPEYLSDARRIWQNYVPQRGQADTVQGELLRAVERLRNEAQRNGNVNWSDSFERLVAFIRTTLVESALFPAEALTVLNRDLDLLYDFEHPVPDDGPFDRVTVRVVDWCRAHPEAMARSHDPLLML